jgi:hypothetical protein
LQSGGVSKLFVSSSGNLSPASVTLANSWNFIAWWSSDLRLYRDAAGTLAQRNGVNAQTSRIYNTYTNASNYERGHIGWNDTADTFVIGTEAAGTGTGRSIKISGSNDVLLEVTNNTGSMAGFRTNTGATLFTIRGNKAAVMESSNLTMQNMPTSDPGVAGQIWNDSGTLKISAG